MIELYRLHLLFLLGAPYNAFCIYTIISINKGDNL